MLSLTDLHALIHSLSKSEKRYVKLFAHLQQGDKTYWQLYRLMQREPDARRVKAAFAAATGNAPFEPARQHLSRMLLKALRTFQAGKSVHARLLRQLQDAELLLGKGLITAGFAQLQKAKALALRYEKFTHYLLIARMELQYLTELEFPHVDEPALIARQEKISEVLHRQLFIHRHASLYEILLHRYFHRGGTRSPADEERLNDLLLEEHQLYANKRYASFESAQLHLHFQSTFFLMTGRYQESLSLFGELMRVFNRHPDLWADEPRYYLYLTEGIFTGLKSTHQHGALQSFFDEVKQMGNQFPQAASPLNRWIGEHEIGALIDRGAFADAANSLTRYEAAYADGQTPAQSRLRLAFYAAYMAFGLGDYTRCLQQINRALGSQSKFASHPLYGVYRLLHLMVHVELGNVDYLAYEIESVERKLRRVRRLYRTEKAVLHSLRRWVKTGGQGDTWTDLHARLQALATDAHEGQLFGYVDLVSWAEAKKRQIPFAMAVQEKATAIAAAATFRDSG